MIVWGEADGNELYVTCVDKNQPQTVFWEKF